MRSLPVGKASRAFRLEIDRELAAAAEDLKTIVAVLALDGLTRIVQRTPVDTGRARGNWTVSIGSEDFAQYQIEDRNGGATIQKGAAIIQTFDEVPGFPSIFIQNNLPYIERLEDGYSKQSPPNAMVALTLTELMAQIR